MGCRNEQQKHNCGETAQGQGHRVQTEHSRVEEGWAEQSQVENGWAEQSQAGQGQAEQDHAEQNQAEQNQAEQGYAQQGINMPAADDVAFEGSSDGPQVPFNSTHCQQMAASACAAWQLVLIHLPAARGSAHAKCLLRRLGPLTKIRQQISALHDMAHLLAAESASHLLQKCFIIA